MLRRSSAGLCRFCHFGSRQWRLFVEDSDSLPIGRPRRFGTLCHELAHIYLGHLGTDRDHRWPSRTDLDSRAVEIEAESTAFIVTNRLGLAGSSVAYVSRYLDGRPIAIIGFTDQVAKVASRIDSSR
jgi:hypothetical protein